MGMKIECVLDCSNHLGEGPVWDVEEARLYWVDGTGRRVGKPSLWRMDPRSGKVENWTLDRDVGAMALRRGGGAVFALDDGFYFFDYDSGKLDLIAHVDAEQPRTRLNDGKCDRRGRFFAGGMDDKEELKICGLWRLDADLSITKVDDGIICSNGPCWSPDDRTFYLADTFQGEFWAYDYDLATGALANKRVFARFGENGGVADGSTVDAEGCMWNAELISGDLVRYAPDGTVERRIGMPVRNVTSVMFGGEKLDEIYVTSMARVKHPAVHDLFRKEAEAPAPGGQPVPRHRSGHPRRAGAALRRIMPRPDLRRSPAMPRKFVDLSIFLENDVVSDPPAFAPKITYVDHQMSAGQMLSFFPGLKKEDLPDGEAWAIEKVELITHNGTHLDAPYHFHSTMNRGERAIAIDEVPLEWCFQPGVKLDFRDRPDGYVVTAADVEAELARIGHALKPLEIVVVNTARRQPLRPRRLRRRRLRHGLRGDHVPARARRTAHRHRCVELGRAVRLHRREVHRKRATRR